MSKLNSSVKFVGWPIIFIVIPIIDMLSYIQFTYAGYIRIKDMITKHHHFSTTSGFFLNDI